MAARDNADDRGAGEQLLLAGLGLVALAAERADRLTDALADLGWIGREDARETLEELTGRWRGDTVRLSERARESLGGVFRELGLVTREEWEELELRVAQLEHRLRLLESRPAALPSGRGR